MTTAFVLGNGKSRQSVDLQQLQQHGKIYGCNALYREFRPDVLVASDREISEQIQHSGYALNNVMYTRHPIEGLGARRIHDQYWGYSSGPAAVACAAVDRHTPLYLLGFDLGGINGYFNNIYADTEFYKSSAARPTYSGNWIRQIITIAQDYPHAVIIRVLGPESTPVTEFEKVINLHTISINEFLNQFN